MIRFETSELNDAFFHGSKGFFISANLKALYNGIQQQTDTLEFLGAVLYTLAIHVK